MQQRKRKNKSLATQKRVKRNFFFSSQKTTLKKIFRRRELTINRPLIFLIIGLGLIVLGGTNRIQALSTPTFFGDVPVNVDISLQPPVHINIPAISVDLPVKETVIKNDEWEISKLGVSHLATSANPGKVGNIILYGHNTNDRLAQLIAVEKGDKIYLKSANGKTFIYQVVEISVVDPTNLKKLNESSGEMLTIYTCTGFADLKRLLVKAKRINPELEIQI